MALLRTISLSIPGYGKVDAAGAYCMIVAPVYDKLALTASFKVAVWKDKATRDAFGTAQADYVAKVALAKAADEALRAFLPQGGEDAERVGYLERASVQPRATLQLAQINLQDAAAVCNAIVQMPGGETFNLTADISANIVTADAVDMAKAYAWLKTKPDWADAEDA